jgi:hypothetical protein
LLAFFYKLMSILHTVVSMLNDDRTHWFLHTLVSILLAGHNGFDFQILEKIRIIPTLYTNIYGGFRFILEKRFVRPEKIR